MSYPDSNGAAQTTSEQPNANPSQFPMCRKNYQSQPHSCHEETAHNLGSDIHNVISVCIVGCLCARAVSVSGHYLRANPPNRRSQPNIDGSRTERGGCTLRILVRIFWPATAAASATTG